MIAVHEVLEVICNNKDVDYVCLLMRHAEKQLISDDPFGNDVGLTDDGITNTKRLEKKLQPYIGYVASSPLKRCVDTAEILSKNKSIHKTQLLGDPGIFIENPVQAGKIFLNKSPQIIANHLLSVETNPDGFCRSTSDTISNLINQVIKMGSASSLLSVFVTHDIILAIIVAFYFSETDAAHVWPCYLEGLLFWREEDTIHFYFRGREIVRSSSEFFSECIV